MANKLYITATESHSGKSAVVLGLMQLLMRHVGRVGFFRPIINSADEQDHDINLVLQHFKLPMAYEDAYAYTFKEARDLMNEQRQNELFETILQKYRKLEEQCDFVLIEGSDFLGKAAAFEFDLNTAIAANMDCPLALVVTGTGRTPEEVVEGTKITLEQLSERHQDVTCLFINRAALTPIERQNCLDTLRGTLDQTTPVFILPEEESIGKPTMGDVQKWLDADVLFGGDRLDNLVHDYLIAAMQVGNFLNYVGEGHMVVTPGDRSDIVLASLAANSATTYPSLAGILLTGGLEPSPNILRLTQGWTGAPVPILCTSGHTYKTIMTLSKLYGRINPEDTRKIDTALTLFDRNVDSQKLATRIINHASTRMTPVMFEFKLIEQAKRHKMRIVLPEGEEERILRAADVITRREVAEVILLGNAEAIATKANALGLDISGARILQPQLSPAFESYAQTYYELRKSKGVTLEVARDRMADCTYFGTMMVYKDDADGMVSGSINTTAHTIRPAFEFIKTKPGFSIVSSVFLMCMKDRVLVFGDCAVNPNPTAEQLAEIAINAAHTARVFGIDPRVAMLSYSTGASGKGADVEVVAEATRIAHERAPELLLEGPIQYDAAIDPDVARTKLPHSQVAGKATVFIFPDLNTGNNTYKAVQRAADAIAIGPVLQGLNKPVNDLSRGCLVPDIINTVTITAIQAQAEKGLL